MYKNKLNLICLNKESIKYPMTKLSNFLSRKFGFSSSDVTSASFHSLISRCEKNAKSCDNLSGSCTRSNFKNLKDFRGGDTKKKIWEKSIHWQGYEKKLTNEAAP